MYLLLVLEPLIYLPSARAFIDIFLCRPTSSATLSEIQAKRDSTSVVNLFDI